LESLKRARSELRSRRPLGTTSRTGRRQCWISTQPVAATCLHLSRVVVVRVSPRLRAWAGALGQVAHSGPLRRAQTSFAAMWAGESAFMVALAVVAFRDGGVAAVGAVTAARMAPAALLAPFLATMADRVRRGRVLACVGVVRAATLGCAAVMTATGARAAATYGFAVVATVAMTLFRPAHSALLPALAKSPQELTSANAVRGMLDSLATLGGPVVAAVLLAASGPAAVFASCSAASRLAGLVVVALPYDAPPRAETAPGGGREVLQGFATIAADRRLGLVTVLGVVQTFTRGCLTVFAVVVAIDLLDTGDPGAGVLNAAVGAGGVLGSILAFGLVRRGGLASWFGLGITLFGAPLALIGVVPGLAAAIVLLGVVGIGNALIDVGGFTLLARLADETVLARMFAGFEAILTLGVAAGGLLAPLVIELLGVRLALVAIGLMAPLAWPPAGPRCAGSTPGWAFAMRTSRSCVEFACWVRSRRQRSNRSAPGSSMPISCLGRRCSSRASAASASTSSSPVGPRWSATDASSRRSDAATASARSPCCATSRERPPFAHPRTQTCA
jgi:MFS family permease